MTAVVPLPTHATGHVPIVTRANGDSATIASIHTTAALILFSRLPIACLRRSPPCRSRTLITILVPIHQDAVGHRHPIPPLPSLTSCPNTSHCPSLRTATCATNRSPNPSHATTAPHTSHPTPTPGTTSVATISARHVTTCRSVPSGSNRTMARAAGACVRPVTE